MEKETRSAIEKATQRARALLETEFTKQLEGTYDVLLSGSVAKEPGQHLEPRERLVRERIVAAIEHKRASGMKPEEAVLDYRRDLAFTTLNRFAALKMLEARDLVQECVSKGELSSGYKEFSGLAPGVALLPDGAGYRLYIESLFDELSTEVKVLFERCDVASALWPGGSVLSTLLEILNDPQLAGVWAEDETIGWVYQYFNSGEERREMREAQAPQDGRELAIRNQFFTPKYVVQFLVDNTLGRLWYEMHEGRTRLGEYCRYLTRREAGPSRASAEGTPTRASSSDTAEGGTTFVPCCAKLDPRGIRILDPACGSAHFLLYAFELLLLIYEEAWADPDGPPWEHSGQSLRRDYPELTVLRREVPRLILHHNLHGIDIDARCAQIAQLSLWLRAQRAYQEVGIAPPERLRIDGMNIVVAEPIAANSETVEAFLHTLTPPLFADLARALFARLPLAGELGSLLDLDTALREIVADAKRQYQQLAAKPGWLPGLAPQGKQATFDFRTLTDSSFLDQAEAVIGEALETFRGEAPSNAAIRWRLFAADASQGVAFFDLARQRYHVVLMNPPFGDPTPAARRADVAELTMAANDLGAAFVRAARVRWAPDGFVGVLASTRLWFKPTVAGWRKATLFDECWGIRLGLHLGGHVLDQASVSASALVLGPRREGETGLFIRLLRTEERERSLLEIAGEIGTGELRSGVCYSVDLELMGQYRGTPLAYWISGQLRGSLARFPGLEPSAADVRVGVQTSDDPRFVRAWWEVEPGRVGLGREWAPFAKGSEYSPFWDDITWIVRWKNDGAEIRSFDGARPQNIDYLGRAGVAFPIKAVLGFNPRPLPLGSAFGHVGPVAFPREVEARALFGYLASRPLEYVFSFANGSLQGEKGAFQNAYDVGTAKNLPWPRFGEQDRDILGQEGEALCSVVRQLQDDDETTHQYSGRPGISSFSSLADMAASAWARRRAHVAEARERRTRLDEVVARALQFDEGDLAEMEREFAACELPASGPWSPRYLEGVDADLREEAAALVSELVGMAFGRFDVRIAMGLVPPPDRESPFAPLPITPPAFLGCAPAEYPLTVPGDGILVEDRGHPRDITAAVRQVVSAIWKEGTAAIEEELNRLLGVRDLLDYFASSSGFFEDHRLRYAKARRSAPIYWRLGPASGSYSVVLYWLAAGHDTLFKIQADYVAPKLQHEERRLEELRREAGTQATATQRKTIADQEGLVEDVRGFLEELTRVAPLWRPDADDGVVINSAPLWRLAQQNRVWQRDLSAAWDSLCAGDYDWAHLAMHLWPERVVRKCADDRSLAIAHDLEEVFWHEGANGKWGRRPTPTRPVADLVQERRSPAVEAALKTLMHAPSPAGVTKSRPRKRKPRPTDRG